MRNLKSLMVLAALAVPMTVPGVAGAAVEVTFTNPDKYIDASSRGEGRRKADPAILAKLRQHLEKQGERYLKPGQTLRVEVLDLDLAGRVEWWHSAAYDIRFMRDIDSPSMKLRYSLTENGATLASGEERILDLGYLMGINLGRGSQDSLKYDKAMLTDWFRKRFAKFGASAS
ncbi:MAG: DUF3016 domain-containing protein [Rhodospirillaceae bacterium]|nr:DUF3016 domain-containing protein [Rhodospirillaceae bacterium]